MSLLRLVGPTLVLVLSAAAVHAEPPAFRLPPGDHGVGYRIIDSLDPGRSFGDDEDPRSPVRPRTVTIHLWYPAADSGARPVAYADYLLRAHAGGATEPETVLEAYRASPLRRGANRARLDAFLDRPMRARLDAEPGDGPFPLVVYAPSINADPYENAVLFEHLASLGFVVASAPSLGHAEPEVGRDRRGAEAQRDDLRLILDRAWLEPYIDRERIGVVGFSWGGMTGLLLALDHKGVDAVVCLDGAATIPGYRPVAESFVGWDPRNLRAPLLEIVLADEPRTTDFHESAVYADRILWRIPDLLHRDFSADSVVKYRLAADDSSGGRVADAWSDVAARVTRFLSDHLREDGADTLARQVARSSPASGAWTWRKALPPPPSPSRIAAMVESRGAVETAAFVRRLREKDPGLVPVEETRLLDFAYQWGPERSEDLAVLLELNLELFPGSAATYYWMAQVALANGDLETAASRLEQALAAQPDHDRAQRLLARLTGEPPPPPAQTAIREAVESLYVHGLRVRDFTAIREICTPETVLMGRHPDGSLNVTTLDRWSARFDPEDPPFATLDHEIERIDVQGDAAQVRIRFLIDGERVVTDFLQMLRLEDRWRIVNITDD